MKIEYDNIKAKVYAESQHEQSFIEQLRYDTSIIAPGARYMYTHKQYIKTKGKAGWDGKVYSVDKNGTFLSGLVPSVLDKASKNKISYKADYIGPNRNPGTSFNNTTVQLRPYQMIGVNKCLGNAHPVLGWSPRGIIQVATGGGKTEMAISIYQQLPLPTIFFVQLKSLLKQTADRFQKYSINPGIIGDRQYNISNDINIATVQTVVSLLKKGDQRIIRMMKEAKQVFFDEAHGIAATVAKGNTFVQLASMLENAFIRWGLTATPFMRDIYSNNLLEGVTGPVLYKISSDELIKDGYLTPPDIQIIQSPKVPCKNSWPECYDSAIVLNAGRNKQILEECVKIPKPCLIMCTQIAHAKIIERNAILFGLRMGYLDGQSDTGTRNHLIAELVLGNLDAIVCTTIFNAGIDIPQLKSLILAAGGRSKVAQLQKLGRGLRRAAGKSSVTVIDFWDTSSKILERHSKERMRTWENEGFKITSISNN